MVLYGITLVPLVEELKEVYTTILYPLYPYDVAFDGLVRRSAEQLHMLLDQGPDQGYFPEPDKLILIDNNPKDKEATRREFEQAGSNINHIYGSLYLEDYLGPRGELEECLRPKV